MKKTMTLMVCLLMAGMLNAQNIDFKSAKFQVGDNMEWKNATFDDSSWKTVKVPTLWDAYGVNNPRNYAWYRMRVVIPKSLLDKGAVKDCVKVLMGKIDDCDETYLNGQLIGKTGSMPGDKKGFRMAYDEVRSYVVSTKSNLIKWDKENVIAVRVYNGNEPGGIYEGKLGVAPVTLDDVYELNFKEDIKENGQAACALTLKSLAKGTPKGKIDVETIDIESGKTVGTQSAKIKRNNQVLTVPYDMRRQLCLKTTFTDQKTGLKMTKTYSPKYILTPAAPATPRYNGPLVYGARPGSPIIFKIPVTGDRPMKYSAKNLPEGLTVNPDNGVISGSIAKRGAYNVTFVMENAKGKVEQPFSFRVDNKIGLTPPMGWNSWNCWGLSVSQEKVMSSAKAILDKGLADYGYSYINVDDAWEAKKRNADGTIATNEKFPDMKGLGDWLHENGLKFGIYSSPGDYTCGGYLGSIGHEEQDANTYNSWGVDYLKYDWCGYSREFNKEGDYTVAAYVRPYLHMEKYLRQQPRDIFYSLCQYGMADVWKWGEFVDANSWRTTGDITDTWESLYDIGFQRQVNLYPYAKPGHWNDPDMLIVGKVGWSNNLRDSRLTPDEQYSHISLWALLAANMLIGCDVSQIDDFTIGLLCNNEVNAVNQDVLGKQAKQVVNHGNIQIWSRPLADGSHAIGIFNVGEDTEGVGLGNFFSKLGIKKLQSMRDLWRQEDLSVGNTKFIIPSHGVRLLKVRY